MRNYQGIIDMVVSGSEPSISFVAQITGNKASHKFPPINRRGRGSTGSPKIRLGDFSASGSGSGLVQWQKFPFPSNPKYATGTLTRVMQRDITGAVTHSIAFPVRITDIEFEYVEKNNVGWRVSFTWEADGAVTILWGGTQVTVNAPSANDQQTYEGLAKLLDGNDLTSTAAQRIDCEGIADSDAAEVTKLVAMIAGSSPMTGLKIISAQWVRSDSNGGQVVLTWGKRDSKDEQELPRTTQSVDSTSIGSEGSIAELDGTPSVPGGYVLVSTVTEHPTTDHSVTTLKYALRTTAGGIEFDESEISTDPNDLVGYIVEAHVYTTLSGAPAPSPPTGFRTVTTSNKTINNLKSKTVFRYGKKDSKDELQLPATFTVSDTNNLGSYASVAVVDGSPSTPSGFTARTSKTQYIVDVSLSSGHTLTTNEYGLRSTADDLQMPGTWNRIDPSDLESEGIKTQVYTTAGGVPSAPTPPTGLVIVASRTTQENTIKSKAEWWFGKDTSIQKWVNAHSETMTDPSNVASTQTTAAIDGTPPALDAGFYDRGIRQIQITHDHTGQIREGGKRYTEDDIIMPATSSFRSALAPYRDSIAQLLNSSASDQSVADAQWATFQSIANAYAVRVRSINREEKLLVFEYLNPGIQVIASTRGGGRIVPARINSGTAQVFVARKRSIDGTRYKYTLRSKYIQSAPIRQFTIVRLLSGTTIPEHATLIGQTNNASFLGLSSGTCLYIGDEAVTNISLSGTYPFMMYYHFWSDAIGIFDYEGRRDEEFVSTSSTPAEGWTAASGFASNEVNIIKPTQADFSVFIT